MKTISLHARIMFLTLSLILAACHSPVPVEQFDASDVKLEISKTLNRQAASWNQGDIDGFMEDYLKDDMLRFASGGTVERGWQRTHDRYKARYPTQETMGTLSFTELEINVITDRDALVFGRWELERSESRPNGLFTLHMKRRGGVWLIVSDHTSSAQ